MHGYHATPAVNRASIEQQGLLPRWVWVTTSSGLVYQQEPVHIDMEHGDGDFISDLHGAPEVAIYKVDLDGLVLHPGIDGPPTVAIYEWVKPDRLSYITTEQFQREHRHCPCGCGAHVGCFFEEGH
jgi:hypothetical protein